MVRNEFRMMENAAQKQDTPSIFVERTLALIKPNAIHKTDEIEDIIIRSGFSILQKRRIHLSPDQCIDFYAEHYGQPYFKTLTAFMSSGPIVALALARHQAIATWKELMGPSNSIEAKATHPDCLRARFGMCAMKNAVHGSESFSAAERELRFMFPNTVIEPIPVGKAATDYLKTYINPTLLIGLTELCKAKPADPFTWLADWLIQNNPNQHRIREPNVVEDTP